MFMIAQKIFYGEIRKSESSYTYVSDRKRRKYYFKNNKNDKSNLKSLVACNIFDSYTVENKFFGFSLIFDFPVTFKSSNFKTTAKSNKPLRFQVRTQ